MVLDTAADTKDESAGEPSYPVHLARVALAGILRHPILVCVLAVCGALCGMFLALITPNQYRSTGKIMVRPAVRDSIVSEQALAGIGGGSSVGANTREAVLNEMQFLNSPALFRLAVERIGPDSILRPPSIPESGKDDPIHVVLRYQFQRWWFGADAEPEDVSSPRNDEDRLRIAAEILQRSTIIVPEIGTSVISVYCLSHSPQHAQLVLDAVLDSARDIHGLVYDSMAGIENVARETQAMEEEAGQAESALTDFRREHEIYNFEDQVEQLQAYLGALDRQIDEVEVEIARSQEARNAVDAQLKELPEEYVAPGSARQELNPEYQMLLTDLSNLRAIRIRNQHEPGVAPSTREKIEKDLKDRIDDVNTQLEQEPRYVVIPGTPEVHPERIRLSEQRSDLVILLAALERKKSQLQDIRKRSQERLVTFESLSGEIRELSSDAEYKRAGALRFRQGIDRLRVVRRLEQLNISNVQIIQRASLENQRMQPSRTKLVAAGTAAGGFLGCAIAAALAIFSSRILSRAALPLAGWKDSRRIVDLRRRSTALYLPENYPERVRSASGAIAKLWARLPYDATDSAGLAVAVLPTSADSDGVIAASLALGLALHAGESVGFVATTPAQDWLAKRLALPTGGLDESEGLETSVPGLTYYPVPKPLANNRRNPGPAFRELLRKLRERHRFVVVATPSLIEDPSSIAILRLVDGVYVETTIGESTREELRRSVLASENAGARPLALVLKPAPKDAGALALSIRTRKEKG